MRVTKDERRKKTRRGEKGERLITTRGKDKKSSRPHRRDEKREKIVEREKRRLKERERQARQGVEGRVQRQRAR